MLSLWCAPTAIAEEEWEFLVAPLFLWGMSIDGVSAIDGNALPLDLSFSDDVFDNLNTAISVHFEARKGDLLLFTEYQYARAGAQKSGFPLSIAAIPAEAIPFIGVAVLIADTGVGLVPTL